MAFSGSASRLVAAVGDGGKVVDLSPHLSGFTMNQNAGAVTAPALGREHETSVVLARNWSLNATGSSSSPDFTKRLNISDVDVMWALGHGDVASNYGLVNGSPVWYGKSVMTQWNTSSPYNGLYTFDAIFTGSDRLRTGAIMYIHEGATRTSFTGYTNINEDARLRLVGKKVQLFVWTDTISNQWTLTAQTDGGNPARLTVSGSEDHSLKFTTVSTNALPATKVVATQGVRFTWRATASSARWRGMIGVLEE